MKVISPLIRTVLPLVPWTLRKACGPIGERRDWKAVALSFVPPPQSVVAVINKECGGLDSPALLSPSYRRRLRNHFKKYLKHQSCDNPMALALREYLLHQRRELEAVGYSFNPARIRKLQDIEAESNEYFNGLAEHPELPEEFGATSSERAQEVVSLLWEFATYGEGSTKPQITRSSAMWNIFGLNPGQLETMPPEERLILCLRHFMALFGLGGQPPDEAAIRRLLRWVVRTHLPPEKEPETTPGAIGKAAEAGLIHRGIVARDEETREVINTDVEDTSATQFVREVEENNVSEVERQADITELFRLKGIEYQDLTPKEWDAIFARHNLFRKDYESSSKTGVSIRSFYGAKAHAKEQQWSRIKTKIRNLLK